VASRREVTIGRNVAGYDAIRRIAILLLIAFVSSWTFAADEPSRSNGVSVHMLPKRVADLSGRKWGFAVDFSKNLKPENDQPVLQTAEQLLAYVSKQDLSVQRNGVWIVTSHPDSYSEEEKAMLEDVKALCRKQHIPLFVARAAELPDGWRRFDLAP
jgi:hypothetical protein